MKHLPDVLILVGLVLIIVGAWWMFPPAALIIGGILLCGLGWHTSK